MLLTSSINTEVAGTDYRIQYTITKGGKKEAEQEEFGVRCELFDAGISVSLEEVTGITTDEKRIHGLLQKLRKYQVFPAHIKDVTEDFLLMELEERGPLAFGLS